MEPKSTNIAPLTPSDRKEELRLLKSFVKELSETQPIDASSDEKIGFLEWHYSAGEGFYEYELDEEVEFSVLAAPEYETLNLNSVFNNRTYHAKALINKQFTEANRAIIRQALERMISRMVKNQMKCFIRNARPGRNGLRNRRLRSKPFPHILPYMNPSPNNIQGQITEEAGVIEAALFFVFGKDSKATPIELKIENYRNDNPRILGKATVNYYNEKKSLLITLNTNALTNNTDVTVDEWAGVIAHEILHNLGWQHPADDYTLAMPIEIYQKCISEVQQQLSSEFVR